MVQRIYKKWEWIALEAVWMLCPAFFTAVEKNNYRGESFTQVVNSIVKWPLAHRKLYQKKTHNKFGWKEGQPVGR